jgi:hypothetical protein
VDGAMEMCQTGHIRTIEHERIVPDQTNSCHVQQILEGSPHRPCGPHEDDRDTRCVA